MKFEMTCGKTMLVDPDTLSTHGDRGWYINRQGYVTKDFGGRKNRRRLKLHRLVVSASPGDVVDHINGNKLDNRTSNLRICTKTQNTWNRKKQSGSSRYKGVTWYKPLSKWMAQIQVNRKHLNLGYYESEEAAAKAYDDAALKLYGEYAWVNTR